MGSSVSMAVANLVEYVKQRALSTFYLPPQFWKRYVDDTCTVLSRDLLEPFHKHLKCIEPCIQFTVEKESDDRRLPFLDVQLCREDDGSISASVYRKAIHTDQYLSFISHHPMAHKVAVKTLMTRANALSSSGVKRVEEEKNCGRIAEKWIPL